MLVYNHLKEFTGISDTLLKQLGFENIEQLNSMTDDFATLFVEKPGYVHNFRNFSWVDFVLHSNAVEFKAVIDLGDRTFSCDLEVKPFYVKDDNRDMQVGYEIELNHLSLVNGTIPDAKPFVFVEDGANPVPKVADPSAVPHSPAPAAMPEPPAIFEPEPTPMPEPEPEPLPVPEPVAEEPKTEQAPLTIELPDDIVTTAPKPVAEEKPVKPEPTPQPKAAKPAVKKTPVPEEEPLVPYFEYDPTVAADDLGLPVDLIEEFIGDFIEQSHSFKDDLWDGISTGDTERYHALSHKLKGVAANLRIDQAFEPLKIINTNTEHKLLVDNFNKFYAVIDILDGKGPAPSASSAETPNSSTEQDNSTTFAIPEGDDLLAKPVTPKEEPTATDESDDDDLYDLGISITPPNHELAPDLDLNAINESSDEEEQSPEEEQSVSQSTQEEPEQTDDADDIAPLNYDPSKAAQELGLPIVTIETFIDDFKQQSNEYKEPIHSALNSNDYDTIQKMATKLKGISDTLKIEALSGLLSTMQSSDDHAILESVINDFYLLVKQL